MELLFDILFKAAVVSMLAASIYFASHAAFDLKLCFLFAFGLGVIYLRLIYPFFDPLRKSPLIDITDIRVLLPFTDAPRGEDALRWFGQYPGQDIIRVRVLGNTTALVPTSPAALRDLMSTHQNDFEKPISGRNFLSRILGYGLILTEGPVHARQRKQLTSSFRIQNIRALHQLMAAKSDILIENLKIQSARQPDTGIEICEWGSRVTLDIIGRALMSREFDALRIDDLPVSESFTRLTAASPAVTIHFLLGLLMPKWLVSILPTATNRMIKREVKVVRDSCEESLSQVFDQVKGGGKYKETDILASIIADPGASRTEIVDQMVTFLGAGHETTATSIAWVTHLLTLPENYHYQDLLREEVASIDLDNLSPAALESLPWLNAICEETLRLFPPVTTTARKSIRSTTLAGNYIFPGQLVTIFPWAINRNPKYWNRASEFVPERWIDTRADGTKHVNGHGGAESNYCNMTFLHGNRSCIGKTFAKAELRLIIAKMFREFEVRRLPGDDGKVKPVGSVTIKPEGGLYVTLKEV